MSDDDSRTDVIFVQSSGRSEDPFHRALVDLKSISAQLRSVGFGLQADRLDEIAKELVIPELPGYLSEIGTPYTWVTPSHARYLAELLSIGADIVRSLMADAEITGSTDTLARARVWLRGLGLEGVERES